MINLELYKIFYTVAECKNITKASEVLNISQPAVTKHIKNLEEQIGSPLFIRTKKGVLLNEAGEKIFLNVKQALSLLEDTEKTINSYNNLNSGTIKIGTSTTLTKKYLLKYIVEFHKLYPNVVIDIYTEPTRELIKMLKLGSIDLIVSKFPKYLDYDLNYDTLGKTEYIFVSNNNYSCNNKVLSPDDIFKYPILLQKVPSNSRSSAEEYFRKNKINLEPTMNIASSTLLTDFIKIGYGIGYVTKLYVEEELNNGSLTELKVEPKPDSVKFGVITLKNNTMRSICYNFIDILKKK